MGSNKKQNEIIPVSPHERGYIVRGSCGREWFVPLEALRKDYIDYLIDSDGLSEGDAAKKIDEDESFLHIWFVEQCSLWCDIERLGRLVKESATLKTKAAMDNRRGKLIADYEKINISTPANMPRQ